MNRIMTIVPTVALAFSMAAGAGPAWAHDDERSPGRPSARKPAGSQRPSCEVGQVPKWDGAGWKCANDLVGGDGAGTSGVRLVDAGGAPIGPVAGTVASAGRTLPNILLSVGDPRPFLLTVDEGGFEGGGRLYVPTSGEAFACAAQCLTGDPVCLGSCLTATAACRASNAVLEALPTSQLFRIGGVIDPTPEKAELWAATSATAEPLAAECADQLPLCVYVSYRPSNGTCGADIASQGSPKLVYPAQPLVNLHALHPLPYAVEIQ